MRGRSRERSARRPAERAAAARERRGRRASAAAFLRERGARARTSAAGRLLPARPPGAAHLRHTSVEITFTLDDSGKPVTVALEYRHRMDESAKECMRTAALALQFPPSLRGKQTGTIEFTPPQ